MAQTNLMTIKKDTVDWVEDTVKGYIQNNELHLPKNYSPDNALKSAWLNLQEKTDKNGETVLKTCTTQSIALSLLDMIVQGMNPSKDQCYFIAYGKKLTHQRSYFGDMTLVKRLSGAKDVYAQVVWDGDEFEYEIDRGNKKVTLHKQKIQNIGKNPIAAYCIIDFSDGRQYTDIMTMEQVEQSWKKSKLDTKKEGSTHKQFPEQMIKRTVIKRACTKYINSSVDDPLLLQSMNRAKEIADETEFEQEVDENANQTIIDIDGEKVDTELGEVVEEAQNSEEPQTTEAELVGADKGGNGNKGPGF